MAKYEYIKVNTSNLAGLKQAEKLHLRDDTRIISSGIDSVLFERVLNPKQHIDLKV